jgi:hypothetical protein
MHVLKVLVVACAVATSAVEAQNIDGMRSGVSASVRTDSFPEAQANLALVFHPSPQWRNYAPIASAIVPGSGQALLGDNRFVGYLAVEALAWWMYAKDVNDRSARENQFKELARDVARVHFTTTFPDAEWSYYEWMRDELESGVYSKTSSGPVVPETDPSTYNGKRWETLQSIYPTTAEALARYEQVAIKPEFRWSWRNHRLEYDIYKRYTDKRNDANRAAVRDLLLVGANHVLSMVDAFATLRLQVQPEADGRTRVGASLRW